MRHLKACWFVQKQHHKYLITRSQGHKINNHKNAQDVTLATPSSVTTTTTASLSQGTFASHAGGIGLKEVHYEMFQLVVDVGRTTKGPPPHRPIPPHRRKSEPFIKIIIIHSHPYSHLTRTTHFYNMTLPIFPLPLLDSKMDN